MSILHASIVESPIDEVFAWFSRPGAFERLSPPWAPVTIVAESPSLEDGIARLSLPLGFTWVARHDPNEYRRPHRFVDVAVADGPSSLPVAAFTRWRHIHEFAEAGQGRTRIVDRVETPLGSRVLRPMFRYRHGQVAEDLATHQWAKKRGVKPTTIAVTGASGLIGSALCAFLTTGGHRVIRLVRGAATAPDEREWDPDDPANDLLDDIDAVIHLAGESIAGRFTERHKRAIRDSRIEPTRLLADVAANAKSGPSTFVVASAIGYYGADRGDDELTEESEKGQDFLAEVVADWEDAAAPARAAGIRVAMIRTGIVQSARGGSLKLYRPLFAAGLGGKIADGTQWVSWIDIDDLVGTYHRAVFDPRISGPVNAVAPQPVRNAEYARILAKVLKRPAIVPVPALGPRMILGKEGSQNLVEGGQRVTPSVLTKVKYPFRRADLETSLRHQLGKELPL